MRRFLKNSCAIEGIWKTLLRAGFAALISHYSHRPTENACVKRVDYVKSASQAMQDESLQRARNPQARHSDHGSHLYRFPFQHST